MKPAKGPNLNQTRGGPSRGIYITALITWRGNVSTANEKRGTNSITKKGLKMSYECFYGKKKFGVACILFSGHSRWPTLHT